VEYSFVHHTGVLWTSQGPRQPDGNLWHANLPMHPEDASEPILLEGNSGATIETTVIELAGLLLRATPEAEGDPSTSSQRALRSLAGSVAQLTSSLGSIVASATTQSLLRETLRTAIADVEDPGWVAVRQTAEKSGRAWIVEGVALPANLKRAPQRYASVMAANRNADRIRSDARIAVVSGMTGLPQARLKDLLSDKRPFSLLESMQLATALNRSPIEVLGLG
jgi:hypothetical protein